MLLKYKRTSVINSKKIGNPSANLKMINEKNINIFKIMEEYFIQKFVVSSMKASIHKQKDRGVKCLVCTREIQRETAAIFAASQQRISYLLNGSFISW